MTVVLVALMDPLPARLSRTPANAAWAVDPTSAVALDTWPGCRVDTAPAGAGSRRGSASAACSTAARERFLPACCPNPIAAGAVLLAAGFRPSVCTIAVVALGSAEAILRYYNSPPQRTPSSTPIKVSCLFRCLYYLYLLLWY